MLPPRLACLYVPDFRLQVALHSLGGDPDGGLALVDPEDGRRRIVAASPNARLDGVRRGLTAVAAAAIAPEIMVREIDVRALDRAATDLETSVRRCCPQFESTGLGVIYASFRGLERHYDEDGPGGFLDDLRDAAARVGLPARVGLASNRFTARAAAIFEGRLPGRGALAIQVDAGQEAEFLAPLPLELLPFALEEVRSLHRLGLRTLGDFAQLPPAGVSQRFGPRGLMLQRLASGEDRGVLVPTMEPRPFVAEAFGDVGVGHVDALLQLCDVPLRRLLQELDDAGLGVRTLRCTFRLDGAPNRQEEWSTAEPWATLGPWRELFRLAMERMSLEAPVLSVQIEAVERAPRVMPQISLLGERGAAPGAIERVLAQLDAEVGPDGFGAPALVDAVRPEASVRVGPFAPGESGAGRAERFDDLWVSDGRIAGGLTPGYRRIEPPRPIDVSFRDGRPAQLRFGPHPSAVVAVLGPWRLDGQWWDEDTHLERTIFQVRVAEGTVWIADHGPPRHWVVEGWMD